jgi:zinc protease
VSEKARTLAVLPLLFGLGISCMRAGPPSQNVPAAASSAAASAPPAASSVATDLLGPRPVPSTPPPFTPPAPQVLDGPEGSKLWLLERHGLPLVSIALIVPYGSAAEPPEKAGLAHAMADMLDEGAGSRDAIAFSQAMNDLGARFTTSADRDATFLMLDVLASRLEDALPLLGDAAMRPRLDKKDWTRVKSLWLNALKARADDPEDVARVVTARAYYGPGHPYGHPQDGTLSSAKSIELSDIVRWHRAVLRPTKATLVVAGDVTREKITELLAKAFAGWSQVPRGPVIAPREGPFPAPKPMRTALVDRKDAPQIVMSLARSGPAANDPSFARLSLLNVALGGSFTSRLNQNLREDHGWTYGARSRFNAQRNDGLFVVRAAIRSDAIAAALDETGKEIVKLQDHGLDDSELPKLKALVNGDALQTYGTLHGVLGSLASNAALGLAPDEDARQLASQRSATDADLAALAKSHLDISNATIVLVGPKDAALSAFASNKLPPPELLDPEGKPVSPPRASPRGKATSAP